jgi:hypothetical protein
LRFAIADLRLKGETTPSRMGTIPHSNRKSQIGNRKSPSLRGSHFLFQSLPFALQS